MIFRAVTNIANMQLKGEGMWNVENEDGPFGRIFCKDRWAHHDDTAIECSFYEADYDCANL